MKQCNEKGSHQGDCCCNCAYQCDIVDFHGERKGYGCAVFFIQHQILKFDGIQKEGDLGKAFLWDHKHGMCEMHNKREE